MQNSTLIAMLGRRNAEINNLELEVAGLEDEANDLMAKLEAAEAELKHGTPQSARLERENTDLRTILRQSNKWQIKQANRIIKQNATLDAIKEAINKFAYPNGGYAECAKDRLIAIRSALDTFDSPPKLTTGDATGISS